MHPWKIDRVKRDLMADALRCFIRGDIKSYAFMKRLDAICDDTDDRVLVELPRLVWALHDDVYDRPAYLSKQEWAYAQRVLLLLESDAVPVVEEIPFATPRVITAMLIAASGAAAMGCIGIALTVSSFYAVHTYLLCLLVIFASHRLNKLDSKQESLQPFSSLMELHAIRKCTPRFVREPYASTKGRATKLCLALKLDMVIGGLYMMVLAPVLALLTLLSLPWCIREKTVRYVILKT